MLDGREESGLAAEPMPATTSETGGLFQRFDWGVAAAAAGFVLIVVAGLILHGLLTEVTWREVWNNLAGTAKLDLVGAALATMLSYAALIGYDVLALRQVGARNVGWATIALTSFVSQAFTFTLGFGLLSGGAVRLRLYTAAGLSGPDIVAVGVLCTLTFWLGLAGLAGATLVAEPGVVALVDELPRAVNITVGLVLLASVAAYIAWTGHRGRSLTLGGWKVALPGWRPNLVALALGSLDIVAAAAALWLLIPSGPAGEPVAFMGFLAVFILATVLGVVSHAPGGLGVFEATMLLALPSLPTAELVASLVLFRVVYYLIPFVLALLLLAGREVQEHSAALVRFVSSAEHSVRRIGSIVAGVVPQASALSTFGGGVVLILSGATPSEHDRLAILRHVMPLPFVETSHLLASVVGVILLVLATGLARRLRMAWRYSIILLALGALFSLAKGLDYEEATICAVTLAFLLLGHRAFYRQTNPFAQPLSSKWLLLTAVVVGASIWLGFFVYQHVEYAPDLWWEFAYRGDAPRFLRATLAVCITLIALAVYAFLHRLPASSPEATPDMLARVATAVAASPHVDAQLALLGDKHFLLDGNDNFVMYGVHGRSIIAMGDPVAGSEAAASDLIWRFKEFADAQGATPVFYQASREVLPLYVDAGFMLMKIGEEAWVDLHGFTLEGSEGRKLRQSKTHAEKSGATFEIIAAGDAVAAALPELRQVSNAWLGEKGREKGFSLGFWNDDAMHRCDQAVIRHEGRIVAFANLWRSGEKHEFSVDLMRHLPDAPGGVMDLLFIGLLSRAKEEGFRWFGLGMGPLSGLADHHLAPLWTRLGSIMYRQGDRFYNFQGLRAYKEKFKPEWRPRYLAYPSVLGLPEILLDVTNLIAKSPQRSVPKVAIPPGDRTGLPPSIVTQPLGGTAA